MLAAVTELEVQPDMINEQVKENKPGQRKSDAYQNSCSWRRKLVLLHMCKFPLRDISVFTHVCADAPASTLMSMHCQNRPNQVMEVEQQKHESHRER